MIPQEEGAAAGYLNGRAGLIANDGLPAIPLRRKAS